MSQRSNNSNDNSVEKGVWSPQLKTQRIEKLEQVISGISHDLLNAVNVVELNSSFLKDAYEEIFKIISINYPEVKTCDKITLLSEKSSKIFKSIDKSNGTVEKITHGLLRYLQSNEDVLVSVNTLIEQVMTLVKNSIEKSIDSIILQLEVNCPNVCIDSQLLMQSILGILVHLGKDVGAKTDTLMVSTAHRECVVTVLMELVDNKRQNEGNNEGSIRGEILEEMVEVPRQILSKYDGSLEVFQKEGGQRSILVTLQLANEN